jgi:hypothetical protein
MKKLLFLTMMLIAVFSINAYAQGEGAVKVPFDPDVGWAIVNTTANGILNVTAHLENGRPNQDFSVSIRIRYEDASVVAFTDIATLSTNGQGKGNVQAKIELDPPADSSKLRRVAVRVRRPGPPNILYIAVAWDLPLK